jgi:hypothetical protein
MPFHFRLNQIAGRWFCLLSAAVALCLPAPLTAWAYDNTFEVGANGVSDPLVNYTTPIQATNFINGANGLSSQFSVTAYTGGQTWQDALFHGWRYTLNFTNYGEMDSLTGFNFDTQTSQITDKEAGNFYNSGSLNCGNGVNAIFLNYLGNIYTGYYGGYGGINVWATNVFFDVGSQLAVGPNGLIRLSGHNLSFNSANINIQSLNGSLNGSTTPNVSATGQADITTNSWSPTGQLTATTASVPLNYPSIGAAAQFSLYNSVPFFRVLSDSSGSNVIVRAIFLQDNSYNVTTNVYIYNIGNNNGGALVEWAGSYTDPATGNTYTNYLYLQNDFVVSASTNILAYGDPGTGVPANLNFYAASSPLTGGAAPLNSSFANGILSPDALTNNIYSYANVQLVSVNAPNSPITTLESLNLTNLTGRIELTASNQMNIAQTALSGMNYLLLRSTNEFDYTSDTIAAPYADMYLGRTNGNMVITNLIQSQLPQWSGSLQAYSTRWSNSVNGINYDYRIMLVQSSVSPVTPSYLQDFVLNSSNNVVISDTLNVTRKFSLNCTNLLVTANGLGTGSQSFEGEVNLDYTTNWMYCVPRLSCLTNFGLITTPLQANYGSAASPYISLYNAGNIENAGNVLVYAKNFENYGSFYAYSLSSAGSTFNLQAQTAKMTNGILDATGGITLQATNLTINATYLSSGGGLTLIASNLLTDGSDGTTNGAFWSLGTSYAGFGVATGLSLPVKPAIGDLLQTTITDYAISNNEKVVNTWAGQDYGYSSAGYHNNAAIGQLVLDAQVSSASFSFGGTGAAGVTNAIYVDCLQLQDYCDYHHRSGTNISGLSFSNNVVIYYAQALSDGVSVAEAINHWNGNHLRWVPSYAGAFSSTYIVYPDGSTNAVNAALAAASDIDSDRDGIVNSADPSPVLVSTEVAFTLTLTNKSVRLQWPTIPLAGNYIYYKTNLTATNWMPFVNFQNYYYGVGNGTAVANSAQTNYFISPQPYHSGGGGYVDNGQMTNVWVFDTITNMPHFYRIMLQPN